MANRLENKAKLNNAIDIADKILEQYGDDVPRFNIKGMNKSEFLQHIAILCFNAGWDAKTNER